MPNKKYKNEEVRDFILFLGSELADLKYIWSSEIKRKFNNITSYLSSH